MFYVKEKYNNNVILAIAITSNNVFCRCPHCGAEVSVDLNAFFGDENFDLDIIGIYCDECGKRVMKC